ncbi:hypothetical protein G7054_g1310 [Neopestalotiopsis clavispora]|nr:hypothetical protein G7054_g1310 [Neopestalotiopsis clavispora]
MASPGGPLDFVSSLEAGRVSKIVLSRIGQRSFSSIRLNSNPESLLQFVEIFSSADFHGLVKSIHYDIILPSVSEKRLQNKLQSSAEAAENTIAFTRGLSSLFTILSAWNVEGIALYLTATSPSDDPALRVGSHSVDVKAGRNDLQYITFDGTDTQLPSVRAIGSLNTQKVDAHSSKASGRRLHPDLVCAMAAALPALESAAWEFFMPPRRMVARRQTFRAAIARLLMLPSLSSIRTLHITLHDKDPRNEEQEPENFASDGVEDDLSVAVQRIVTLPELSEVNFSGKWSLSPVAFKEGFGPSLSSVYIDLSSVTPDGKWLFDIVPLPSDEEDFSDEDARSEPEQDFHDDFDSADSDVVDQVDKKAEARANFDLPATDSRGDPSSENFIPLATSIADAVSSSHGPLRLVEVHLLGSISHVHFGYLGSPNDPADQSRFWGTWPDWSRDKMESQSKAMGPSWQIFVWGEVVYVEWRVPTVLRQAMEKRVGQGNVFAWSTVREIEFE